jgi:hypothetical protein
MKDTLPCWPYRCCHRFAKLLRRLGAMKHPLEIPKTEAILRFDRAARAML